MTDQDTPVKAPDDPAPGWVAALLREDLGKPPSWMADATPREVWDALRLQVRALRTGDRALGIKAQIQALKPDASSVVIVRVDRFGGESPDIYGQRAQGVMRAVSHAVREAAVVQAEQGEAPPNIGILVTDERVAVQLVPDQAKLLHEIHRWSRDFGGALPAMLQARLDEVHDAKPRVSVIDEAKALLTDEERKALQDDFDREEAEREAEDLNPSDSSPEGFEG